MEPLSYFVGVQEQRQTRPCLRDTEKESFRTGAEMDGCDVPIKTKMLTIRQNKAVLPNIRRSHSQRIQHPAAARLVNNI
jgi:hypothetical protein